MPLKLIPPGKRKNKTWAVRGTIGGQRIDAVTGAENKKDAARFANELERRLLENAATGLTDVSFAHAADAYCEFRQPPKIILKSIHNLKKLWRDKSARQITQADIVAASNLLFPNCKTATKNRYVVVVAAAILHYAAKNGWCEWLRVSKFKEPEPKTRFVTDAHEEWLMIATENEPQKQLLIMWLFRQGDRISDALSTRLSDCDLGKRTVRRHIKKTDTTIILPLDDEICARVSARKNNAEASDPIFIWKTRWGVAKWLRKLCALLEIDFSPHMARHTLGKRLSDSGASLRVIMDALGHRDSKSSLRYQRGDVESVRVAKKMAATGGKLGEKE